MRSNWDRQFTVAYRLCVALQDCCYVELVALSKNDIDMDGRMKRSVLWPSHWEATERTTWLEPWQVTCRRASTDSIGDAIH